MPYARCALNGGELTMHPHLGCLQEVTSTLITVDRQETAINKAKGSLCLSVCVQQHYSNKACLKTHIALLLFI